MTQHIGIIEINEQNGIERRSNANFAIINTAITRIDNSKSKFPWLSTIDEYGDTIFNYLQLPHIVNELKEIDKTINDISVKDEIRELLVFIGNTETHKYIKFLGD